MTPRKALTFIEIDVSICGLTYGTAPCTASVPTTGPQKCLNTIGTCQDRAHYDESIVTLRFAKDTGYQAESGIAYVASNLVEVNYDPGRIGLGDGLGKRSSLTAVFREHPFADTGKGFDPYLDGRAYDPFDQGTFWARFRARHPNLRGKKMRVIRGYLGQTLEEMETRHFIIDSTDGPSLDGRFTLTSKDPLKALDGDRAQAPRPAKGYLNASISNSTSSATLAPSGIGNSDYPASGYLALGNDEIVSYTRSGDALTISRGQYGTVGTTHNGGDRVQPCLVYVAQDPADLIRDLLVTYGGLDASYINLAEWQAETATYSGQVLSAVIPAPTAVKTLVAEICEHAGLALWWDDIAQKLRLQVLRNIDTSAARYDETKMLKGSFQLREQPDKRASQVWVYFAIRNPLEPLDKEVNFYGVSIIADADLEADYGGALIRKIFSRWIPAGGRAAAARLTELQLGRYFRPPREFRFALTDTPGSRVPAKGAGIEISAPMLQDAYGAREIVPAQVVSVYAMDGRVEVVAEELHFAEFENPDGGTVVNPLIRNITLDYHAYNLNLRDVHDALWGSPIPKGVVNFTITSGGLIGSTSTAAPALQSGTWPSTNFTGTRSSGSAVITGLASTADFVAGQAITGSGIQKDTRVASVDSGSQITLDKTATASGAATLTRWDTIVNLIVNGRVQGAGANGVAGKGTDNTRGQDGLPGGTALQVTAPINLTGAGMVKGGGGSGGGAGGDYIGWFGPGMVGGGSGGGAGDVPGAGGPGAAGPGATAQSGQPGSLDAGGVGGLGAGGNGTQNNSFRGGNGGAPGAAGGNSGWSEGFGSVGGAAGKWVEGSTLLKTTGFAGSVAGGTSA